jgi:Flp pilus assembly protein TadD
MTRGTMVRRIAVVNTAVMTALLAACGGEDRSAPESPIVIAAAPAALLAEAETSSVAVTASPRPVTVSYGEAEAVFRKGRYTDAATLFGAVVEAQPSNAFGHYMLGLSAWKSGDRGRAEQALTRAVELNGESVKIRTNLGRVLLEQGRPADALPHLEQAIALEPGSHEVWRVLGNVYGQMGRGDDALAAYREALILNDEDAWTMNNYGLVLIQLGRYEDARPPLARAVELQPRSPVFRNNLGVALERTGQLGGAEQAFAAAVAADSTYAKARISLERVTTRLGDTPRELPDLHELARLFELEMQSWIREEEHDC